MEVDHIFICTQAGAPETEALLEFGLAEGEPNRHLGQRTANRRFFFHNAMLELLWVEDIDEVRSELTRPMKLYERCFPVDDTVSPFGIAFRPSDIEEEVLFEAWDYHPMYLPDPLKIQVAVNVPMTEPLFFYLPFARSQAGETFTSPELNRHHIPISVLTNVRVITNCQAVLSSASRILNRIDNFHLETGKKNLLELEFDNGLRENSRDFRPELPLIIRW